MNTQNSRTMSSHPQPIPITRGLTRCAKLPKRTVGRLGIALGITLLCLASAAGTQSGPLGHEGSGRALNPNDVPQRMDEVIPDNSKRTATPDTAASPPLEAPGESPFLRINDFRSVDGYNNNRKHPEWGQAGQPFVRISPPAYGDGADAPSGEHRPNVRDISNMVMDQVSSVPSANAVSDFVWQWGQFLDHDLDLTPTSNPVDAFDIAIPVGDPWFDPQGLGTQTIPFNRSLGMYVNDVREQFNSSTAYIDASQVYGSEEALALSLRTLDGTGRLKTSSGDLLPFNLVGDPDAVEGDFPTFFAGDRRAMEQVGLTVMHTLFLREHNYWADRIAKAAPGLDDEGIYQRARAMVAAEIQCITYNEFLPILLGKDALGPYAGYQPDLDATISNEFATAAYRVGHTMLSPQLLRLGADLQPIEAGPLTLRDAFFNPAALIDFGIEPYLRGLAAQTAQEIDCFVIDDVRNFLFGQPGSGGFDLSSLNLQRGRDHGLADYNTVRVAFGLPAVTSFEEVSSNPTMQQRLKDTFGSVDDVDLWVAGVSEDHVPGAIVGETFRAILQDQFIALRDGDRYWYQRYLPIELQREVEARTLSTIIRQNSTVGEELGRDVWRTTDKKATGSLSVQINPLTAVANGAKWRVAGGEWHDSGDVLRNMPVGIHVIEYSDAAGFFTPSTGEILVAAKEKVQMTVSYLPIQVPGGCQAGTLTGGDTFPRADALVLAFMATLLIAISKMSRRLSGKWAA